MEHLPMISLWLPVANRSSSGCASGRRKRNDARDTRCRNAVPELAFRQHGGNPSERPFHQCSTFAQPQNSAPESLCAPGWRNKGLSAETPDLHGCLHGACFRGLVVVREWRRQPLGLGRFGTSRPLRRHGQRGRHTRVGCDAGRTAGVARRHRRRPRGGKRLLLRGSNEFCQRFPAWKLYGLLPEQERNQSHCHSRTRRRDRRRRYQDSAGKSHLDRPAQESGR